MHNNWRLEQVIWEAKQEISALEDELAESRAAGLTKILERGEYKGEVKYLTVERFQAIYNQRYVPESILTPDRKHVYWEYALDGIATEWGYQDGDHLKNAIEHCYRIKQQIANLKDVANSALMEMHK